MSKLVKRLVQRDISNRLKGVTDAVVANCIGLNAENTYKLRKTLREKGIQMLVVKRSLASRAVDDTPLEPAFENVGGSVAVVWGCEDFVSLAKEVVAIEKEPGFEKFEIKGGVMEGESLSPEMVTTVSKWPSRQEQISMLVGQILSPGTNLAGQILGPGRKLAGQIKSIADKEES